MNNNGKRGFDRVVEEHLSDKPNNKVTELNEVKVIKPNSVGNEVLSTTEAIHQVATILESVPERQFKNIMNAVIAIRRTAHGETVEELNNSLRELERERKSRSKNKPRRGFWF